MFGHLLVITLHILTLTCLPEGKAEPCIDDGVEFEVEYASVGQPLVADCPIHFLFNGDNFNVTWMRNNSQAEITLDKQERVHQDQIYLKIIPVDLHDSGLYQCVLRNSTFCIKKTIRVEVFKLDDGLCYNHSVRFPSQPILSSSLRIACPKIDAYVDFWNTHFIWYKECQPLDLDNQRYKTSAETLIIKNMTMYDSGNYTCKVQLAYNGVTYDISRTTEVNILAPLKEAEPFMIFPANNVFDVELGAPKTLTCEVLGDQVKDLYWTYNGTYMDFYTEDGRVTVGDLEKIQTENGTQNMITLNFTKVIEEDYNRQFYCHIWSSKDIKFYVTFKRPDPNFQGFLIAFFVSMLLLVVIAIITARIFKVDIVLWYRSSCFANKNQKVADGKTYDAYIMYPRNIMGTSSFEMDIFVLKVLPEVLEKQCDYRLFIIGRDDVPGQAVADLVEETISQSRRVIIILGNIFCEKLGDDFEQKIAMYDALIRNKIKVILIEMEKITDYTNMPESIRYIKQKQGVVRWKGEFTESALSPNTRFWKNVRYQMPPNLHHSDNELHYISSEDGK